MSDLNKQSSDISIISVALVVVIAVALRAFLIMFTWNLVMPDLFGVSKLDYVHAVGLFMTTVLLFGQMSANNNLTKDGR